MIVIIIIIIIVTLFCNTPNVRDTQDTIPDTKILIKLNILDNF